MELVKPSASAELHVHAGASAAAGSLLAHRSLKWSQQVWTSRPLGPRGGKPARLLEEEEFVLERKTKCVEAKLENQLLVSIMGECMCGCVCVWGGAGLWFQWGFSPRGVKGEQVKCCC